MALISGGILVLVWILGHDFSGHYKRLVLISVDIISGVYCNVINHFIELSTNIIISRFVITRFHCIWQENEANESRK